MRYIDRTGKARNEAGDSRNVTSLGGLTKEACTKAERRGLGESGLGYEMRAFGTMEEVDAYIKTRIA